MNKANTSSHPSFAPLTSHIAVKEYVRVSEEVEQESLDAVMKGDIALVAELAQYRQSLDKAIVLNSAEA